MNTPGEMGSSVGTVMKWKFNAQNEITQNFLLTSSHCDSSDIIASKQTQMYGLNIAQASKCDPSLQPAAPKFQSLSFWPFHAWPQGDGVGNALQEGRY